MFNFLKRKKSPTSDSSNNRDLEQVILDFAQHNRVEDFQVMCQLLNDRQVHLPVDVDSLPKGLVSGEKITLKSAAEINLKIVTSPDGHSLAAATTTDSSEMLNDGYLVMDWPDFLKMVRKLKELFGCLIQGSNSWIILDKEKVKYALSRPAA